MYVYQFSLFSIQVAVFLEVIILYTILYLAFLTYYKGNLFGIIKTVLGMIL